MQKHSARLNKERGSQAYNPEIAHYKGKMKQYKSENSDLREQLQSLTTQYVKLGKEKDKYKKKLIDLKQDIARFDQIVDQKSNEKAAIIKKELRHAKRSIKKRDTENSELEQINKQLRNQLDEQNDYVMELEARIEKLLSKRDENDSNETDHQTPNHKILREEIEIVNKSSLEDDDNVIITTNNTSNKKPLAIRKEAEYPSNDLSELMDSPQIKKFKPITKLTETARKVPKNTLISSLPLGLRETSYFENIDQCRTLLGEKKGKSDEKIKDESKSPEDPSYH
ncbi:unnamed protein product [Moneuplotes crassus]|uniref:Uncharacterized protein n=1 Tax=Euplotes crassus TaxID=5936 RepID=A0AAD1XFR7_EUPCR|nr:unnamed protein product [Moneuplotes crassus]